MNRSNKTRKTLLQKFAAVPNVLARAGITLYQWIFSPSLGILRFLPFYPRPSCVFYPTCSEYAAACFEKYPFFTAVRKSAHRIGRCHSGTPPQVDLP